MFCWVNDIEQKDNNVTMWDEAGGAILDRLLVDLWNAGGRLTDLLEARD